MTVEPFPIKLLRLRPDARLPVRATPEASGFDLYACLPTPGYVDLSRHPIPVPTGIALEAPFGVDVQIRPRSGLSARGVGVTLGTIDADYRGELLVTMYLFGAHDTHRIAHGDRIAQLVFSRLAPVDLVEVEVLSATDRGDGGHGSTGLR
ncbi:MAG: dUTP diphosphatase [Dehalococcoidia bacterium]